MRFFSLLTTLCFVLGVSLSLTACGTPKTEQENAAEQSTPGQDDTAMDSAPTSDASGETMNMAAAVGDHVELTGIQGCGHCQFGKGEGCSIAMQLDNVVYVLDGLTEDVETFNHANAGKQITVVGTLTDAGDPHHIQVESHQVQM